MKKAIYSILGFLLILGGIANLTQPNFGLSTATGAEAIGYNAAIIGLPILGIWLIYRVNKIEKEEKNVSKKSY